MCKILLKGKIHGYAHVLDSINQTTILHFRNNLSAKNHSGMYLMTQIEKSVQSKLQMAEFNKRFSRMTRTMWATNLVLT